MRTHSNAETVLSVVCHRENPENNVLYSLLSSILVPSSRLPLPDTCRYSSRQTTTMFANSGTFAVLLGTLLATQRTICPIWLEVCLSPGCVADGGEMALKRLQALAPPDQLSIKAGTCVSACGNGPIVRENEKCIHKRVNHAEDLIELLLGEPVPENLSLGYTAVCKAESAALEKKYDLAIVLYQQGIEAALDVASLRAESVSDDSRTPPCLKWLVQAYSGMATVKLKVKDTDGALKAAEMACELARCSDPVCWELLATVYQARTDAKGEINALKALFALPVEETFSQNLANRRRIQGFRLQTLERKMAS